MRSHCFIIDNIDKIFQLSDFFSQQGEEWIFRGQTNADWELQTSLERTFNQFNLYDKKARYESERHIIEMGKRVLKARPETSILINDDLDLLSFIQHFGGVTRLLDFTDSFSVALFFATESCANYASVWCLKRNELRYGNCKLLNRDERRKIAQKILNTQEDMSVISFAPSMLNERIYAQQGLFIMPGILDKSLVDLLEQKLNTNVSVKSISYGDWKDLEKSFKEDVLIKFDIHRNLSLAILIALRKLNVSANHLFPDITGICRSFSLLASGYRLNKDNCK